jgi:AcrR family transcriptional regulator
MPGKKGETKKPAREAILETAAELFYREGYRAVGVDTIIEKSEVAKMTLYRHFPSKDDLIVAYLKECDEKFWIWFTQSTASTDSRSAETLLAFFKALEKLVSNPVCYGCPFLNAMVDFPERQHPGHIVALNHKEKVRARFAELAAMAGVSEPEILGDQLLLLMDGAFMAVRIFGVNNPAVRVARAAETLIEAQIIRKPVA